MTMTITKKKMAQEAREANVLHQEEELTKREKTLIDEEAAQADRDKIKQKKWVHTKCRKGFRNVGKVLEVQERF